MATHFSILAWKISWTEDPGGLQSGIGIAKSWTQLSVHARARTHTHTHTSPYSHIVIYWALRFQHMNCWGGHASVHNDGE